MTKLKVISIGAAVQDVFLTGKILEPVKEEGEWFEELPLGSKLDLDQIFFSTGGGATNAAVTFAKSGFDSHFLGQIGHDPAGEAVLRELKSFHVNYDMVVYDTHSTGYSVLLLAPSGERTILTYRGASTHYDASKFRSSSIESDWLYISSLSGNIGLLEDLVAHAKDKHIKVALNPGKYEIKHAERFSKILQGVTVLSANLGEMSQLFSGKDKWELAIKAVQVVDYVLVTDGPNGAVAASKKDNQICEAGLYENVKVVDRTGAGDAFSSGFVAKIASGAKLQNALVFASANATSVVTQVGAKAGILAADSQLHDMNLRCEELIK